MCQYESLWLAICWHCGGSHMPVSATGYTYYGPYLWQLHGNGGEIIQKVDIFAPEAEHPIFFLCQTPSLPENTSKLFVKQNAKSFWFIRMCTCMWCIKSSILIHYCLTFFFMFRAVMTGHPHNHTGNGISRHEVKKTTGQGTFKVHLPRQQTTERWFLSHGTVLFCRPGKFTTQLYFQYHPWMCFCNDVVIFTR